MARRLLLLTRSLGRGTGSTRLDSNELRFAHLGRGTHSVTIVAVDRAGNRSAPAVRRFGVPVD